MCFVRFFGMLFCFMVGFVSSPMASDTPPEETDDVVKSEERTMPQTEEECVEQGGRWGRFGLRGFYACDMPTEDAGQACRDSSECQSICVAPQSAEPGEEVTGSCFERTIVVGTCLPRVNKGVATPTLCVD